MVSIACSLRTRKLSLALALPSQELGFQRGLEITDQVLQWYKTVNKSLTSQDWARLIEFAKERLRTQITPYLNERAVTHPRHTMMFPASKEIIKGSLVDSLPVVVTKTKATLGL